MSGDHAVDQPVTKMLGHASFGDVVLVDGVDLAVVVAIGARSQRMLE